VDQGKLRDTVSELPFGAELEHSVLSSEDKWNVSTSRREAVGKDRVL